MFPLDIKYFYHRHRDDCNHYAEQYPLSQLDQVHGDQCIYVDQSSYLLHHADAQWTDVPGLLLSIKAADCIPILLYIPGEKPIVATIHAGWQGIAQDIIAKTLIQLQSQWYNVSTMQVRVGPSISTPQFAFGADGTDPYTYFPSRSIYWDSNTWYTVDLRSIANHQLLEHGITQNYITRDDRCTYIDETLASRRRDAKSWYNNYFMIWLPSY